MMCGKATSEVALLVLRRGTQGVLWLNIMNRATTY